MILLGMRWQLPTFCLIFSLFMFVNVTFIISVRFIPLNKRLVNVDENLLILDLKKSEITGQI